ncbi:MAG: VOC family protein [Proteobacteria bacterium]|nr:VOC family protein [Pseudomonadota bacterium]
MARYAVATALCLSLCAAGVAQAGDAAGDPPGPLASARLMQITLPAKDLDRSVAFYDGVLGVKLLFRVKGAAFLDAGGVRLRLEQSGTPAPTGAVELYFDDPGLSRAKPLAARGVRFVGPPETVQHLATTDVQLLELTDPDGNALALMGEVPRK